jgi:hypothetical protein
MDPSKNPWLTLSCLWSAIAYPFRVLAAYIKMFCAGIGGYIVARYQQSADSEDKSHYEAHLPPTRDY